MRYSRKSISACFPYQHPNLKNDWTSFPHSHHFTEIFFIKDGTGRMLIENESLPVSSNSLVVIGAQVTHTEFSDPENPLDYYVLGWKD